MPRPDKPINSRGRLDEATSPSRAASWTKHGGPETLGGFRGAPSSIEVTVDDITIVDPPVEAITEPSKWEQRGTAAQIPATAGQPVDPQPRVPVREPVTEWVVLRTIDGRTYRRTDALTVVSDPAGA